MLHPIRRMPARSSRPPAAEILASTRREGVTDLTRLSYCSVRKHPFWKLNLSFFNSDIPNRFSPLISCTKARTFVRRMVPIFEQLDYDRSNAYNAVRRFARLCVILFVQVKPQSKRSVLVDNDVICAGID